MKITSPVDTGRKLNIHKTFRRRPGRLLNILCMFNLRPVSTGKDLVKSRKITMFSGQLCLEHRYIWFFSKKCFSFKTLVKNFPVITFST